MEFNILVNAGECDGAPVADMAKEFLKLFGQGLSVEEPACPQLLERLLGKGRLPDAAAYAPMWLEPLALGGRLADLGELCRNESITAKQTIEGLEGDFFSGYLEYAAWVDVESKRAGSGTSSKLYALPGTHTGATLLFYRRDLFERHGLNPPRTWREFSEAVQALRRGERNIEPTALCTKHGSQPPVTDWYNRFVSRGGKHIKDGRACANCEEGIAAYNELLSLASQMPPELRHCTEADCLRAFAEGRAAMVINVSSFAFPSLLYSEKCVLSPEQIGVAPIPGENGLFGVGYGGGWSWAIPKNARDVELSWRAIQFFSSKEFDAYRCSRYGTTPVRRSTTLNSKVCAAQPWVKTAGEIIDRAVAPEYFFSSNAPDIMGAVAGLLDSGLRRGDRAELVLGEIDKAVEALLCKAQSNQIFTEV